jgi:hypothetical protein
MTTMRPTKALKVIVPGPLPKQCSECAYRHNRVNVGWICYICKVLAMDHAGEAVPDRGRPKWCPLILESEE